jgi:hypothetical protein
MPPVVVHGRFTGVWLIAHRPSFRKRVNAGWTTAGLRRSLDRRAEMVPC